MFANLVKYANAEESCGFESPVALANTKVHGATGYRGGDVIIPIDQAASSSSQSQPSSQKIATVRKPLLVADTERHQQVFGIPTGDPEAPAVPTSNMPAIIKVNAELENFELSYSNSERHLAVKSGRLSGSLTPRMFLDTTTGACSASTSTRNTMMLC